jgi:hypothetical protein
VTRHRTAPIQHPSSLSGRFSSKASGPRGRTSLSVPNSERGKGPRGPGQRPIRTGHLRGGGGPWAAASDRVLRGRCLPRDRWRHGRRIRELHHSDGCLARRGLIGGWPLRSSPRHPRSPVPGHLLRGSNYPGCATGPVPGQQLAFIRVFGPHSAWSGWFRDSEGDALVASLVARGLPRPEPGASTPGTSHEAPISLLLVGFGALATLLLGALARRSTTRRLRH